MALSLRDKSVISRRIKENTAKLSAGGLSLREKSAVSRAIKEDVALLSGTNIQPAIGGDALSNSALSDVLDIEEKLQRLQTRRGETDEQFAKTTELPLPTDNQALIPPENEGRDNKVKTAKGTVIGTKFAVIEADRLIVSHDENGNPNPDYPQELQPRDRGRETSQAWVLKTAKQLDPDSLGKSSRPNTGAPIVGSDLVVEAGNGRTMAIKIAYKHHQAQEYKDWLIEEAEYFGLNPAKVKAIKHPVLVRVRKTTVNRESFAVEANQDDQLAMTATEKARADAKRLTDAVVSRMTEDGDLTAASNRDFIQAFMKSLGDTEAAQYVTTSGAPTKQLYDRVQAAVFAKAYNDDRLLELMADTTKPEISNIISALNTAAPAFIRAQNISRVATEGVTEKLTDGIELSLDQKAVDAIINATNLILEAKNKGLQLEELIAQTNVFGESVDSNTAAMALFIKNNNRSAAKMGVAFKTMAEFVENELENRQNNSLIVDEPEIDIADVLQSANAELAKRYGDRNDMGIKGAKTLGGFIDIFTPTHGQESDRQTFNG